MNLARSQRLLDSGQYDAAAAALGPVDPSSPSDPRAAVVHALIDEARGDLPGALADLEKLRLARPDYAPGHLHYGILAGDAGEFASSVQALKRVLELQPANDVARSYLGLALLQLGRDAEAVENFRAYGFSDNRMFRVRLSEWMEQQWLDGDRFFGQRPAASTDPAPASAPAEVPKRRSYLSLKLTEHRATRLCLAKRYPEMLQVLDPLVPEGAADEGALFTCAFGAEMIHDYQSALRYLEHLPQDTKTWPDPLLASRARILVRLRRFREAVEDLNEVEIIGPEDYGANYYFGVLCLAHGDRAQARRLFHRAHTQYLIDTLEYQWWQIEQALLQ